MVTTTGTQLHIKITRPGSLLSVEVDEDITPAQASCIKALLKANPTYGETLAWLAGRIPESEQRVLDGNR